MTLALMTILTRLTVRDSSFFGDSTMSALMSEILITCIVVCTFAAVLFCICASFSYTLHTKEKKKRLEIEYQLILQQIDYEHKKDLAMMKAEHEAQIDEMERSDKLRRKIDDGDSWKE